jgi:hypothetical protein
MKSVLLMFLLCPILYADNKSGGILSRGLLPAITGIGGGLLAVIGMLPLMMRMQKAIRDAAQTTKEFAEAYRGKIETTELRRDIRNLFQKYDEVTEVAADIAKRLQMRRMSKWLHDLIPRGGNVI